MQMHELARIDVDQSPFCPDIDAEKNATSRQPIGQTQITSIGARADGQPSFSIPAASVCHHYLDQLP